VVAAATALGSGDTGVAPGPVAGDTGAPAGGGVIST